MMIRRCERCGSETHLLEKCSFCGKYVCRQCEHAAKRVKKVTRVVICKGCFGDTKKMKEYENWK
ncbi:MAG: hypothetical protein N3H30_00800 [Candidatus Micrarchaeota archaeon]|nr:hypothetical protein [Candidatus Micrarchaeota archaeon]